MDIQQTTVTATTTTNPSNTNEKPEVLVVDVMVKAIKSTPQTQYYYIDKTERVWTKEEVNTRKNITLLWCSQEPGFFICQLEDGNKVKIHRQDLKVETKQIKDA